MTPSGAVQFVLDLFSSGNIPTPPPPSAPPPPIRPKVRVRVAAPIQVHQPTSPSDADTLLARLRTLGLRPIERCRLTNNRRTMVSFRGTELRVHRGYLDAPDPVLRAIVTLVQGRTRAEKRAASRVILSHPIVVTKRAARRERAHPEDHPAVLRLMQAHTELNAARFGSQLSPVPIRISRRMKSRLGHYTAGGNGDGPEIAISRRHLRRHGWADAVETLLHEMVHQWQHESGLPLDHGKYFRRKAREIGISPRAKRAPG